MIEGVDEYLRAKGKGFMPLRNWESEVSSIPGVKFDQRCLPRGGLF